MGVLYDLVPCGLSPRVSPAHSWLRARSGLHVQLNGEFHRSCLLVGFPEACTLETAPSSALISKQIHVARLCSCLALGGCFKIRIQCFRRRNVQIEIYGVVWRTQIPSSGSTVAGDRADLVVQPLETGMWLLGPLQLFL